MATLREYFDTDFPSVLNAASTLSLTIKQADSTATFDVRGRVHYDFDSSTKYASYFIPAGPEAIALSEAVACLWLSFHTIGETKRTSHNQSQWV
jgi:hypothetical protein